ncbi:MAG: glycine cleavage system protein GcvH [Planctomycetota bacterium]|nr:MAG: glycine cleavage system protein GcvH [Planctomycetota bacterium]
MSAPTDRVYTKTHEWIKREGSTITIGLTRYAVDQLTDVTYVELKPVGTELEAGEAVGEVESVKTTSDVYTPVAGKIIEVNSELDESPGLLNGDPFQTWLVRIEASDTSGLESCVDGQTYEREYAS